MDVHVPRAVTTALRLRSIDVLTAQEDGAAMLEDDRFLQRATDLGRILFSQDEDLLREGVRRLRGGGSFSGVIYAHQLRVTIGQMVEDLSLIAKATSTSGVGRSDICRSDEAAGGAPQATRSRATGRDRGFSLTAISMSRPSRSKNRIKRSIEKPDSLPCFSAEIFG